MDNTYTIPNLPLQYDLETKEILRQGIEPIVNLLS